MNYVFRVSLLLSWMVVFSGAGTTSEPIGVEGIKRVLTSHNRWTLYWDRSDRVTGIARPRVGPATTDRSASAALEFMRVGPKLIGHAESDSLNRVECEFEVTVTEDGFTFVGCYGVEKPMTYDPRDGDYPFKGRVGGTLFWLAPSK